MAKHPSQYGLSSDAHGRPINFSGCPTCRWGVHQNDCHTCGGLGVIPDPSTGPGTWHVLRGKVSCWCRPTIDEAAGVERHRPVDPPADRIAQFWSRFKLRAAQR